MVECSKECPRKLLHSIRRIRADQAMRVIDKNTYPNGMMYFGTDIRRNGLIFGFVEAESLGEGSCESFRRSLRPARL